jgi:hypothetical protein
MSVILGFPVDRLLNKNLAIRLPGIGAWYSGSDDDWSEEDEVEEGEDDAQELLSLVQQLESSSDSASCERDSLLNSLTCASIAPTADDMLRAYVVQQLDLNMGLS